MAERALVERYREIFYPVPHVRHDFTCNECLGPVRVGFPECIACDRVFGSAHPLPSQGNLLRFLMVPDELRGKVVPMTAAPNPSSWYNCLATYKTFQPAFGRLLAAVAEVYLEANARHLEDLLGGAPDVATIVPSKRGSTFETQRLASVLSSVDGLTVSHALRFVPGSTLGRWEYKPDAFEPGPVGVDRKRVLLLEDSWVTGATAVSAAGALLREGATAVVIVPIARVVDPGFWGEDHPYLHAIEEPYDPAAWPR